MPPGRTRLARQSSRRLGARQRSGGRRGGDRHRILLRRTRRAARPGRDCRQRPRTRRAGCMARRFWRRNTPTRDRMRRSWGSRSPSSWPPAPGSSGSSTSPDPAGSRSTRAGRLCASYVRARSSPRRGSLAANPRPRQRPLRPRSRPRRHLPQPAPAPGLSGSRRDPRRRTSGGAAASLARIRPRRPPGSRVWRSTTRLARPLAGGRRSPLPCAAILTRGGDGRPPRTKSSAGE